MRLFIFLILVAVILVGLDRGGVVLAQDAVAERIASEYHLGQKPSVHIEGIPFLTQALHGRYSDVQVDMGRWSSAGLTAEDVSVTLSGVNEPVVELIRRDASAATVDTADATVVVPYNIVARYAPSAVSGISYSPDGLTLTGSVSILGFNVPGRVVAQANLTPDGVRLTPLRVGGTSGPSVPISWLTSHMGFVVPLQNLPFDAKVTAVTPTPEGLRITAHAADVHLS